MHSRPQRPIGPITFLKRLVLVYATLFILVGVGWSLVGIVSGVWEESNGLFPLQSWIHGGEFMSLAAIGGIAFLLVALAVGVFGIVQFIRR